MNFPKRKQIRLQSYDYSTPAAYFVTICTHEKKCILARIMPVGEGACALYGYAPPETKLSAPGKIVEKQILDLSLRYPNICVDKFVIMPNHVHLLMTISEGELSGGASPSPTVMDAVRTIKSISAVQCSRQFGVKPLWQRSFHGHVVRNENDYHEIWNYIDTNPAKWSEDRYVPEKKETEN